MQGSAQIRQSFLDFFKGQEHSIVPSSPVVPVNDPTLLFTNAGMVQFKDVFLGNEQLEFERASSSQRCIRAGGKHNDLENVGYTARHHTFFEMLGNFSFGDYFKQQAIHYAWEYLTKVIQLPVDRLWVTVFEEDNDAAAIWLNEIGVAADRLRRIGAKDNFWAMGDTGPCGPCTEIFYDHGDHIAGGPPGSPDEDGDRYIEIWNLVFMQYERDKSGKLHDLPKPSVDTGMGLERLAAILQGVHNNYDTDLFQGIIAHAAEIAGTSDLHSPSLKVLADHIRSCSSIITDGVVPSNEGRGYVLRRIIRRAARHGHQLGIDEPFFYKLVDDFADSMGSTYPELQTAKDHVKESLRLEEERFADTLHHGMGLLQEEIANISKKAWTTVPGDIVFKLYDTYGFPADLTADVAREHGLQIDSEGFEQHMQAQRKRARSASRFDEGYDATLDVVTESRFTGYECQQDEAVVTELFVDQTRVDVIEQGQTAIVVLDKTPFYAESGGQVGDSGLIYNGNTYLVVQDTQKKGAAHAHIVRAEKGSLAVGDTVTARIDARRRQAVVLNHSATHLMHAALRQVLGNHVQQKGSLVAPDRLRFDFSHNTVVNEKQLSQIENIVNEQIRMNREAQAQTMDKQAALAAGAMALFGEKYGSQVRVLSIGDFSVELCGGTHVQRAGDIGVFKIIAESGVAAGVRRIEAVTGEAALQWMQNQEDSVKRISEQLKTSPGELESKVIQLLDRSRELEKEMTQLKSRLSSQAGAELADQAIEIEGIKVLAAHLQDADPKSLRTVLDQLKERLGSAVIVLATAGDEKVSLVAGVTDDLTQQMRAGDLIKVVAAAVGGKGGGRADMAQAGGNQPQALDAALKQVPDWVQQQKKA